MYLMHTLPQLSNPVPSYAVFNTSWVSYLFWKSALNNARGVLTIKAIPFQR
jgi:hypothetical protein